MNPEQKYTPVLDDPWERGSSIELSGILERRHFHPGLVAFLALLAGIISYVLIGNVATILLLLVAGQSMASLLEDMSAVIEENAVILLGGNAIGLFLGLGMLTLLLTALHTKKIGAFLRWRSPSWKHVGLSLAGLVVLLPIVQWLGGINQQIPMPEVLRELENAQMELLNNMLLDDVNLLGSLLMVALVPAFCEEVFFRGYVQRNLERGAGAGVGILLTGLVFGFFHLRFSQFLPLALLGIYLAYLAWRTGSLWIPIIIHFGNNAIALVAISVLKRQRDFDVTTLETMEVPWFMVAGCVVMFSALMYLLHVAARRQIHSHTKGYDAHGKGTD